MLADEIKELEEERKASCSVGKITNGYSGDDRVALIHLIDKTDVSAPKVMALLAKHGHKVSVGAIRHHKRRVTQTGVDHCQCPVEM